MTAGVKIERITVSHGRMQISLLLEAWVPRESTAVFAREIAAMYPTICSHSCINDSGPTFGAVIEQTSIPHVLEHMIIEEQLALMPEVKKARGGQQNNPRLNDCPIVGTTRIGENGKRALIEVSFFDDIIAMRAINKALEVLNETLPCRPYLY